MGKRKITSFFWSPVIRLLKQGLTPHKLALAVAFGMTISVFPVIGTTTVLCGMAAYAFRVNLPAIQLINYLAFPLQFMMLIPFFRMGSFLFEDHVGTEQLSIDKILFLVKNDLFAFLNMYWTLTWHAIIVWVVFAPLIGFLIYLVFFILFKKLKLGNRKAEPVLVK